MFNKPDPKTLFLARYGSSKHIEDAMDKNHPEDTRGAHKDMIMQNPFASKEHLTSLFPHASDLSESGMEWLSKHRNIPDHVKEHMIKSPVNEFRTAKENYIRRKDLSQNDVNDFAKHIKTGNSYGSGQYALGLLGAHEKFNDETMSNLLHGKDRHTIHSIIFDAMSNKINHSHIKELMKHQDPFVRGYAVSHEKTSKEDVEHLMTHDPDPIVRMKALKTKHHTLDLDKIKNMSINDPDYDVRSVAQYELDKRK